MQFAVEHVAATDFVNWLHSERLLVQRRVQETRFLLFLYFGRVQDGLSKFTLRDLGLVQTRSSRESYEPRFSDREEALETFYFADRLQVANKSTDERFRALVSEAPEWPPANFASGATLRDKLAYKLGRRAERATRGWSGNRPRGH